MQSSQIITTNKPTSSFFTGWMPFLSPNQQCQSTEGKNITFHGLAYPKLTWGLPTLSLITSSSWLPWGRVAMPLISRLMPVPLSLCPSHNHLNGGNNAKVIKTSLLTRDGREWLSTFPFPSIHLYHSPLLPVPK